MVAKMFILIYCKNFRLSHFIFEALKQFLRSVIREKFTRSNSKESNNHQNRYILSYTKSKNKLPYSHFSFSILYSAKEYYLLSQFTSRYFMVVNQSKLLNLFQNRNKTNCYGILEPLDISVHSLQGFYRNGV